MDIAFNANIDKHKIIKTAETMTITKAGWYDITLLILIKEI